MEKSSSFVSQNGGKPSVLDIKSQYIPEVVVVRRGATFSALRCDPEHLLCCIPQWKKLFLCIPE